MKSMKSLRYFLRSEKRDMSLVTEEDVRLLIQRSNRRPSRTYNTFQPKALKHFPIPI